MKLLAIAILAITSCAQPGNPDRLDIVLKNDTEDALVIRAQTGWLVTDVNVAPGSSWNGWVLKSFAGSTVTVTVKKDKK